MKRILGTIALCMVVAVGVAQPNYMNYQGKLITETGAVLPPGQHILEVNLYDQSSGGTKVWGPFKFDALPGNGHAEFVSVMGDGRFNIIMGPKDSAGRDLSSAFGVGQNQNRFIELIVNGGSPILPRQQFLSAPYAFQAGRLQDVYNLADGKVGVGTATPTERLDVSGNVKVTGKVTINGDLEFTGKIVNFSTVRKGPYVAAGLGIPFTTDTLLPTNKWFCALGSVSYVASIINNTGSNEAYVDDTGGTWKVTAVAGNFGSTIVTVNCFKYN